ncbi:MAG: ROK family protein [Patescibacteria group bacterium]
MEGIKTDEILCLDLGGTKCGWGFLLRDDLSRGNDFSPENLDDFTRSVSVILGKRKMIRGIALATAGVIRDNKIVVVSPNIPWLSGVNLAEWAKDEFGMSCIVSNDMEAAVAGEMMFGNLVEIRNALMFTISTGLGGAMVVDGKRIISEPGHMKSPVLINKLSRICECGKIDCVEAQLSGGSVRKLLRLIFTGREDLFEGGDPCTLLDKKAEAGIPWATNLYNEIGIGIGEVWGSLLNILTDTDRIIYMGTFGIKGMPFMFPAIKKTMHNRVMFERHKELLKSPLNDDHGLIFKTALEGKNALYGAAAVYEEVLGEHYTV